MLQILESSTALPGGLFVYGADEVVWSCGFNLYETIEPREMDTVWRFSSNIAHSHVQITVHKRVQGATDPL